MAWLDKLERRYGFLAGPGLTRILVGFAALVVALAWLVPGFTSVLELEPVRVRQGEVCHPLTILIIAQTLSPWWILFSLWFLWWIGDGLERAWGPFRLTLYFLAGMIGTTAAAFFFGSNFSNRMLLASLFFAFASLYPDEVIYVLFILPVKIKWLAWASAAFLLLGFFVNPNSYRAALLVALSNYLIFFGPEFVYRIRHRQEVSTRRRRFESDLRGAAEPLHKCAVCGATELSDPNLDFRVARDGEEYCMVHLPKAGSAVQGSGD